MIINSVYDLMWKISDAKLLGKKIVLTSGGFDPPHIGHLECIRQSSKVAHSVSLIVLVNDDQFLLRKKGYVFMPEAERAGMIDCIQGVNFVLVWRSHSQFVDEAIRTIRPDYFTKGGDRSTPDSIAECERKACTDVGCEIVYGVGGTQKIQSSSWLLNGYLRQASGIQAV